MSVKTNMYTRRPFPVEAVQVNDENMAEVSKWCKGRVVKPRGNEANHIKVQVKNPLNPRQAKAYVGDWILFANEGYKVYTDVAFQRNFELSKETQ